MTYYDGYGLNFYYLNYGYYEFSRGPPRGSLDKWSIGTFLKVFFGLTGFLILYSIIYYYTETKDQSNVSKIMTFNKQEEDG